MVSISIEGDLRPDSKFEFVMIRIFVAIFAAHAFFLPRSEAGIIHVDSSVSVGGNGVSWETAYRYLQDALGAAAAGDEIWLAKGTYRPDKGGTAISGNPGESFRMIDKVSIYGGFSPAEGIRDRIARGDSPDPAITVLSGDIGGSKNSYHVVIADGVSEMTILDSVSISDGNALKEVPSRSGGALRCVGDCRLFVSNCHFRNNRALFGGAIFNQGQSRFLNCVFEQNTATDGGGAIYQDDDANGQFEGCEFKANTADYGGSVYCDQSNPTFLNCTWSRTNGGIWGGLDALVGGGAVYCYLSSPQFTNCEFTRLASTYYGGAVLNYGSSPKFHGCSFTENRSFYLDQFGNSGFYPELWGYGGAVANSYYSSPFFNDCEFVSNHAALKGGAIWCSEGGDSSFVSCRFFGNSCDNSEIRNHPDYSFYNFYDGVGGAVYSDYSSLEFKRCEIRGSSAYSGGAFYIDNSSDLVIESSLISGNRANYGGAINQNFFSRAVITNATISGNISGVQEEVINSSNTSEVSFGNSIIWNNGPSLDALPVLLYSGSTVMFRACVVSKSGGSADWTGEMGADSGGNFDVDPLFREGLDPNTAPSIGGNFEFMNGSAAFDRGINALVTVSSDVAGATRIRGKNVDIGAYEFYGIGTGVTFGTLFPAIGAGDDDNANGVSNFTEYAMGHDPSAQQNSTWPKLSNSTLACSWRESASDLIPVVTCSENLEADSWQPMIQGLHYTVLSTSLSNGVRQSEFALLPAMLGKPRIFFRQEFLPTEP